MSRSLRSTGFSTKGLLILRSPTWTEQLNSAAEPRCQGMVFDSSVGAYKKLQCHYGFWYANKTYNYIQGVYKPTNITRKTPHCGDFPWKTSGYGCNTSVITETLEILWDKLARRSYPIENLFAECISHLAFNIIQCSLFNLNKYVHSIQLSMFNVQFS